MSGSVPVGSSPPRLQAVVKRRGTAREPLQHPADRSVVCSLPGAPLCLRTAFRHPSFTLTPSRRDESSRAFDEAAHSAVVLSPSLRSNEVTRVKERCGDAVCSLAGQLGGQDAHGVIRSMSRSVPVGSSPARLRAVVKRRGTAREPLQHPADRSVMCSLPGAPLCLRTAFGHPSFTLTAARRDESSRALDEAAHSAVVLSPSLRSRAGFAKDLHSRRPRTRSRTTGSGGCSPPRHWSSASRSGDTRRPRPAARPDE